MSNKNVNSSNGHGKHQQPLLASTPPTVRPVNTVSGKKHSIDDIIDHMTADLQSYEGQYIVLGSPHSAAAQQHMWSEFNNGNGSRTHQNLTSVNQVINRTSAIPKSPVQPQIQVQPQVVGNHPIFLQQTAQPVQQPTYELRDRGIEFHSQGQPQCGLFYTSAPTRVQDGSASNSSSGGGAGEMIGMVNMGGGNYVNVVFNTSPPNHPNGHSMHPQYSASAPPTIMQPSPPQHQTGISPPTDSATINYIYQQHQHTLNNNQMRDYGLFNKDTTPPPNHSVQPNQQLIENLVGNWLPNQSGTYSPFGSSGGRSSCTLDKGINDNMSIHLGNSSPSLSSQVHAGANIGQRKPRAIAEVRPMRPTYSDVLTKSPPPNSSATVKSASSLNSSNNNNNNSSTQSGNSTPKSESRKHISKNSKSGGNKDSASNLKNNQSSLRRQHSGGSDDNNTSGSKLISNIHKWMSIEELTPTQSNSEHGLYDTHLLVDDNTNPNYSDNDINVGNKRMGSDKKQKKKSTKQKVNDEKMETFTADKIGGISFIDEGANCSNSSNSKRSLQINSSLLRNRSNIEKNLSKTKKGSSKDDGKVGGSSTANSKRSQRSGKRRNCQNYISMVWSKWQHYMVLSAFWFFNLLWDVLALSSRLLVHLIVVSFEYTLSLLHCSKAYVYGVFGKSKSNTHTNNNRFKNDHKSSSNNSTGKRSWWKFWERNKKPASPDKHQNNGLTSNMAIPTTGDEAIRRLLSCKGKDPYSILGVTRTCSDDDIKKYYKRQAVLVHPDKNSQPGAEEAFKILVHAFELIGEPERRSRYDHCVAETHQMEHAWTELNDLLTQLHQKMEYTANTIRCTNCGKRHRRVPVQRPSYAARFCAQCKIHHSAREGDIWAESWIMGFVWHYYACMEGQVYNITEWASCQADNLQHLKANSHSVQYRIVLGKQQNNQPYNQQQHEAQHQQSTQQQPRQNEPDLEEFLSNLYSQSNPTNMGQGNSDNNISRQRKKTKRKK